MEIDESIVQLGAKLDEWLDGNLATFPSQGRLAQNEALLHGIAIVKELARLKAQGFAVITALLDRQDAASENDRARSLIQGFQVGARLAHSLHDELLDVDGHNKVVRLMDGIVRALDKIGSGRAALAVLFDHPDAGVRASAGVYLIDLMPERVVPMLRKIEEKRDGSSALFWARNVIFFWEREGKSRFNTLKK